jgi:putative ABC transport system permease protein
VSITSDERAWALSEELTMATTGQDLRYAIRRMKETPGFTVAAIATLALGLGVNSAVLSMAEAIFVRPLPLPDASRLVLVDQTVPNRPPDYAFPLTYPDYLYYRDHTRAFSTLAAHYPTSPMHVSTAEGGFSVTGSVVTANYFRVLGVQPGIGRFFTEEEDRVPGRNPVAVLSDDLWRSRFGGDRQILGATVRINGTDFTVVGIAAERFRGILRGTDPVDVWIPTAMFRVGYRYCNGLARGCRVVNLVGRLADDTTIRDAQAQMTLLARQLETAFPDTNRGFGVVVRPARGIRIDEQTGSQPIVAMMAAAGALVLLVASANVAGLLLARGLRRRKEIAIRLALGASRSRLVRQLLVESMLLAGAGGLAGLIVAVWSTDVARGFFAGSAQSGANYFDLSLDLRVVAAGFAVALATGLLTGLAPALHATRTGALPALKDDTAGSGSSRTRVREGLIVVQVAVTVLLLAASGLVVRSFLSLHRGPGFDPDAIVVLRLRPSLVGYTAERAWAFQREVIRGLEAIPGVVVASPANNPPLPGWGMRSATMQIAADASDPAGAFQVATTNVGPRYFQTLGVRLTEGREFDDRDRADGVPVAIVNDAVERHFWPDGRATGSLVTIGGRRVEIIGVVKNYQFLSAFQQPQPIVYFDFWQQDTTDNWSHDSRTHVRVAGDAAAMLPSIRRTIAAIDPDVPVSDAATLGARLDSFFAGVRAARAFLVVFGGLALVLSTIGLYAALAFAVGQRTREIAIRMALGAERIHVGRLVLERGAAIVLLGVIVGLIAAALVGPFLAHLLYGVSPRDPLTLVAGPSILAMVALVAIWLPARRAMAMDPMVALRSE